MKKVKNAAKDCTLLQNKRQRWFRDPPPVWLRIDVTTERDLNISRNIIFYNLTCENVGNIFLFMVPVIL